MARTHRGKRSRRAIVLDPPPAGHVRACSFRDVVMMRLSDRAAPLIVCLVTLSLAAGRSPGQTTYTWTNTAGGNFSDANVWLTPPGPPPLAGAPDAVLLFLNSGTTAYTASQNTGNPFQLTGVVFNSTSTGT